MTIAEIVAHLLDGWPERIEYATRIRLHSPECGRHCDTCPSTVERRAEVRRQPPLVTQLLESRWAAPVAARDCEVSAGPTKSKPPGNLLGPDELLHAIHDTAAGICAEWKIPTRPDAGMLSSRNDRMAGALRALAAAEAYADPLVARDAAEALWRPYRRCRVALGYENDWIDIAGTSCGSCEGGVLRVERKQPTVVVCADCARRYPWWEWPAMLEAAA